MWQGEPTKEIEGNGQAHGNPNGDEELPLKQTQLQDEVSIAQELEGKADFEKPQNDLHTVEPTAALRKAVEPTRECREQAKWQRQS